MISLHLPDSAFRSPKHIPESCEGHAITYIRSYFLLPAPSHQHGQDPHYLMPRSNFPIDSLIHNAQFLTLPFRSDQAAAESCINMALHAFEEVFVTSF